MKSYLNLGCGYRFDPSWTNIDFAPGGDGVISHDLLRGIPFPAETFELVYHSHILEHFSKDQALLFMRECCRVLKTGGILRVAVPDLEQIARVYLQALEKADAGNAKWQSNYEWIKLEMYDQILRERPGGDMETYLREKVEQNEDFVSGRMGIWVRNFLKDIRKLHIEGNGAPARMHWPRMKSVGLRLRELLFKVALGEEYELLQLGRFRRGGEVHLWMYDRYSLARLVEEAGFSGAAVCGCAESRLSGFQDYHLDVDADGAVYKPDSLYMEAVKA